MQLVHVVAWHDVLIFAAQHITEDGVQFQSDNRSSVSVIYADIGIHLAAKDVYKRQPIYTLSRILSLQASRTKSISFSRAAR